MTARTVLLVGATQGLGAALAERYLAEGWSVIATSIAASPALDALAQRWPGALRVLPLDITDAQGTTALRALLEGTRIDVLHIVAGILPTGEAPVWERDGAEVLRVLDTNAFGSVRLANAFEGLVPAGGVFAFTSSGMGSMARNTLGSADLYRISKAALNMLVRSFAVAHGAERAVLLICPGWAKTEMGGEFATVEIADSVDGIYRLVTEARPSPDGAPFLEYTGDVVPW